MSKTNAPVAKILIDLDEYLHLLTLKETVKNQEEQISKHYENSNVNEEKISDAEEKFGQGEQPLSEKESVSQPPVVFDSSEFRNFFCQFLRDNYNLTPKPSTTTAGAVAQTGAGAEDLLPTIPQSENSSDPIAVEENYEFRRPVESVVIKKSRLSNDAYDKSLLESVPTLFLPRAEKLLNELKGNENDICWDINGVIYIDQQSLPDSNIKLLFPKLFRKTANPEKIMYLNDVASKISSLGLGSLINRRLTAGLNRPKPLPNHKEIHEKMAGLKNWWFLGD
jgi:hypothetical protein